MQAGAAPVLDAAGVSLVDAVTLLKQHYGRLFRFNTAARAAYQRRHEPLDHDARGRIADVGSAFPLLGFAQSVDHVISTLCIMCSAFQDSPDDDTFLRGVQLLRLTGAPGR